MTGTLRALDLFCGAGGASCGMWQAGADLVAGVDHNQDALETHAHNLPGEHIQHDLSDVDANILPSTDIDWIHGSPPCQGFSQAKGSRDETDERNELVWRFVEWVEAVRPAVVTMENVAGMQTISSTWMDRVVGAFREAGYEARWRLVNMADYGVPQTRERIYVVAVRQDLDAPSRWFPRPTHAETSTTTLDGRQLDEWRTVREAIGDLVGDIPAGADLTSQQNERHQEEGRRPMHSVEEPARTIRCGTTPKVQTDGGVSNHEPADHAAETVSWMQSLDVGYTGDSVTTRRLHPDRPSGTITKSSSTPPVHYVSEGTRRLTVREAARLQTFDDWFVFKGTKTKQIEQVGNAVPPRFQQHMTAHVREVLG